MLNVELQRVTTWFKKIRKPQIIILQQREISFPSHVLERCNFIMQATEHKYE
jgi:hypothetical protein